jgi:hypothetical protein
MKTSSFFTTSFLVSMSIVALAGCAKTETPPANEPPVVPPLLGGDRDAHGCIPSAGYQWCEAKQKCLRTWEEPCDGSGAVDTSAWKLYQNDAFGFSLKFPPSWDGYEVHEGEFPSYRYVNFSFSGTHRPFEIFKILQLNQEQREAMEEKTTLIILSQSGSFVLTCDGCCVEGGDTRGGGQFDAFQQERCAEAPEILKTFQQKQ